MIQNMVSKWKQLLPEHRKRSLNDVGLLLLRVWLAGAMLTVHGWGKLSTFGERAASFSDPIGIGSTASMALATFAEFFCALFVVLGLGTRAAIVPLIVTMAVAAFVVHGDDPFKRKELALTYLAPFVALLLCGAGRFSLDALVWARLDTQGAGQPPVDDGAETGASPSA